MPRSFPLFDSVLLMDKSIFVIIPIIGTGICRAARKSLHFIFIQALVAGIIAVFLIIVEKFAAFAGGCAFVFHAALFAAFRCFFLHYFAPLSQLLKIKNPPCRVKQELKTLAKQGQSPLGGFVLPAFRAKAAQRGLHSRRRSRAQYFNLWV